jgi:NTE family protein
MNSFNFANIFKKAKKPITEVALVLSGGGARGAIHLGVLKALEEAKISITAISGTSMGAIIGAHYSQGYSADYLLQTLRKKSFTNLFNFSWKRTSVLQMKTLYDILEKHIPHNSFEGLKIPFYCCATNLNTGTYTIFHEGNLYNPVVASSSIPVLFEPVKIGENHFVDGGVFNNLPIESLMQDGYKNIVGVHVNNYKFEEDYRIQSVAERVFSMVIKKNVEPNLSKCDYVINPFLEQHFKVLSFKDTQVLFEIGYEEGKQLLKKLQGN